MRKLLLATAATLAVVASPAAAVDGAGYIGVEGGVMFPQDNDVDASVDFTSTQTPGTPAFPVAAPGDFDDEDVFGLEYKTGYDIDLIGGFDFGMFRLEGELGYKRAKLDEFDFDDAFLTALNAGLNRPDVDVAPDPVGTLPALIETDFDLDDQRVSVLSGMVNALVDLGDTFYVGGGFGRARVKMLGESDSAWAWQLIAGARFPISSNIDFGVKYRYFRTGRLDFFGDDVGFAVPGNADTRTVLVNDQPVVVTRTTNANVFFNADNRFSSHSLLASLIFNFGSAPEVLPPPPPPPPPVVEQAPATITCPDGSVILATSSCPPPPPPPPPPVERGERGR